MKLNPIKIKICGVTDADIAFAAAKLGVDFIGLVFDSGSLRFVSLNAAQKISQAVIAGGALPVGIFTKHTADEISAICQHCNIKIIQLHGNTAQESLISLIQDYVIFYVREVTENGTISPLKEEVKKMLNPQRDFILYDNTKAGSGIKINTRKIKNMQHDMKFFIAGGLNIENITAVLTEIKPYGIDISTGAELQKGIKDLNKIRELVNKIRGI